MKTKLFYITDRILLTLWVGGMWVAGYVVAPLLFQELDKKTAGEIGGHLFFIMSYIGLFCGGLLVLSGVYRKGMNALKQWRVPTIIFMLVIIVIGEFVLAPMMAELKAQGLVEGSEIVQKFGILHGIASVLFLVNSIAGLVLIINDNRE